MTPNLNAATYARTSTEMQKSCGEQQQQCRKLIDDRGWKQRFRLQDEGHRGASPDRPAYKLLIELVEEQRIDVVVTWKLDRMFRSLKEASTAQELFQARKVALVSVTEPFDTTTSVGKFVFGFLVNVAAFETDLIRERAQLGYERRTREGRWTGPVAPYGYSIADDGRLAVNPDESTVVALMHRNYARFKGDAQLAAWLRAQGVMWRGKPFTIDHVRRALTNPVTTGDLTQRRARAYHAHLAIVTKRRFKQTAAERQKLLHLGTHQGRTDPARLDAIVQAYIHDLETDDVEIPS